MLEKIDSPTLSMYMAYDRLSCIDNEKLVFMLAQLTALTSNLNGGKHRIADFIPKKQEPISVIDKIKGIFGGPRHN